MSFERRLQLVSSDNLIYHTDYGTCRVSNLLREFIDANPEVYESKIVINEVNGFTLNKVLWWMHNHKHDHQQDLHNCDADSVSADTDSWDRDYVETSCGNLVNIIRAANYLDVRKLMFLAINKLADMINNLMGYTNRVELIRRMFHMHVTADNDNLVPISESHIMYKSSLGEAVDRPQPVYLVTIPQRKLKIDIEDSEYAKKLSDLAEDYLDHRLHLNNLPPERFNRGF